MDDLGVKITGYLVNCEEKVGEYDGVKKVSYRYLVVAGMETYIISSDNDYRGGIQVQDLVTFNVVPRSFSGKIFYSRGRLCI